MRLRPFVALLLLAPATFLAAQTLTTNASPASGRWLTDYAQARAESRRLNMPLVVHFSATWCVPCQAMNRETLHTPAVLQAFGRDVIGVKLDFDRDSGLKDAFRVKSVPADIVIAPDGKIIGRHSGQQKPGPYAAALKHWGDQFTRPPTQPATPARALPVVPFQPLLAQLDPRPRPIQPQPLSQPRLETQLRPMALGQPGLAAQSPPVATTPELPPLIGLDEYSPVRITANRQWIRGQREYAAIWQGVVYYLTSEQERQLFIATPQKYAPKMLGCDPVTLAESGRAIQGSVECGAFYESHLYLFENQESRRRFKLTPDHFLMSPGPLRAASVTGRRLY